jgi:ParB family transcriptional regulator, chromosome partitioning protein
MRIEDIQIDLIDVPKGRRVLDQNWCQALAEDIHFNGQKTPIEVLAVDGRFRLVSGAHRVEAVKSKAGDTIKAVVKTVDEYAGEAAIKLAEITENFMRRGLSVLDKAFDIAAWREIFEQASGTIKPGRQSISRKLATNSDEQLEALSERFAGSFSAEAMKAFGLSRDAVFRALKIARIDQDIRERISLHSIADNQSELLALSAETSERQAAITGLLLSEPPAAQTVARAIAVLDRIPVVAKPEAWAALSDKFGKLSDAQKYRFITENWKYVEAILAAKKAA